jgi:serine/threonine-protein kinase
MTEDEARTALERAGFTMIETRDKTVLDPSKEGLVVKVEPDVGTTHDPDTTTVMLSLGKLAELQEVPDMEGMTLSEAQAALEEVGLKLGSQTPEASDSIESGRVTRSEPAAGEQVRKGTFVDVFVSSGPSTVTVPDVTCRTFNAARNELQNEGFVVVNGGFAPINPACPNPNRVATQDPPGNTQAERGSTVTLFTGEVTSPSPSPEGGG